MHLTKTFLTVCSPFLYFGKAMFTRSEPSFSVAFSRLLFSLKRRIAICNLTQLILQLGQRISYRYGCLSWPCIVNYKSIIVQFAFTLSLYGSFKGLVYTNLWAFQDLFICLLTPNANCSVLLYTTCLSSRDRKTQGVSEQSDFARNGMPPEMRWHVVLSSA